MNLNNFNNYNVFVFVINYLVIKGRCNNSTHVFVKDFYYEID